MSRRDWTPTEVERLALVVSAGATFPTIAQATGRTLASVSLKAKRLHYSRRRIKRENERNHRGLLTVHQVRHAFDTGLIPPADPETVERANRRTRIWTRAEVDFLLEHVGAHDLKWIARELGRTVRAIEHKCHLLGAHPTMNAPGLLIGEVIERTNRIDQQIYRAVKRGELKARKAYTPKRHVWFFDEASVEKYAAKLRAQGWETDAERAETIRRQWLRVQDFASRAGVSDAKVYRLIKAGVLEFRLIPCQGRKGAAALFLNPKCVPVARSTRVENWRGNTPPRALQTPKEGEQ